MTLSYPYGAMKHEERSLGITMSTASSYAETTGLLRGSVDTQLEDFDENATSTSPFVERLFETIQPNHPLQKEATGWGMDAAAKGPLHASAAFLGPALIHLATASARSNCPDCNDQDLYIYFQFIKPSGILAISSMFVTFVAAITLPFWGTMIDYSPYRKRIGAITAALLMVCNAIPIFLSADTWLVVLISQTILDYIYLLHNVIMMAYLQNLTTDQTMLATYTTRFTILQSAFVASYMLLLIGYASYFSASNMEMSRVAHIISLLNGSFLLYYAWRFLLKERPRLHDKPRGDSLLATTVTELRTTSVHIWTHLPSLKWFLLTLLFSPDAGSGTSRGMMATFMVSCLHMEASQIGLATFITLLCTIPGGYISKFLCIRFNPLLSFRLCLVTWATAIGMCAWLVQGPDEFYLFLFSCALWGCCLGWLVPTQRVLFCVLTPSGKETEMMGVVFCCHNLLAWLPPLVFGALVKDVRGALGSQVLFFVLALGLSIGVGTYEGAIQQAKNG